MKTLAIIILVYYVVLSLILFGMMGTDKSRAKRNAWRIPEATLLGLAFLGGAPGGLWGMRTFRHKTQKLKFRLGFPLALILHLALWAFLAYHFWLS